ncbi:molecular chaperone [Pseudoalteromonas sp. MB47]|uniref:molecular chaperone n=1 Tax=Pseudoalteromonas sp. MB47 TaxID=2588452 RepID=UPI00140E8BE4|nr:molecular chaperone [Pseudoalteromonas sp. MB47]NHH88356.1 hypothetical protein [Pseudoalteromonas sp. MB47]
MRIIIFLVLTLLSFHGFTFQVQPMVAELATNGTGSQQTLRVMNNTTEPLTIELAAYELLINSKGEEKLKINEEDFLIIPMTTIIPPGKTQSVLVRYIGDPLIESSKAYRIAVNQVTVDLNLAKQSGVGMSVSFRTLFNVVPKGAKASLKVKNFEQVEKGKWKVLLENDGNKFIRLSQGKWVFKNANNRFLLEGPELSKALTGKLVLPHSSREVLINVPAEFNADSSNLQVLF